ncbi:TPA: ribonuclease HII [Campylobacter jejuni]|uniref:ribonuclease HII n=1 Tax=Campylobacter TaxID=194 RepID=UPI00087435BE|nr:MULTISPECIES: ribonuclease HII [Campylobacter]EAK5450270.1 ribonuclease HII [Campylobacter hyointestinalis]SUW97876.1 ribonuclease HII [Campylobacter jejuni subsp. doylei]HEE6717558.1 ribonuclease HII [Campylobacter jejuni subsp. jejuni]EAI3286061.1 ribonuclease HII [Campylobacter jejuni]EAI3865835.1 ribonuclease HII [Campylobacter jejuni]
MKTLFDTKELLNEFDINLIGIDEAGRGALAGPMMMAACKLNKKLDGLCDSKKLSEKKREELYEIIIKNSNYLILAFSSEQIDTLGLSTCLKTGLKLIKKHFKAENNFLYDGNTNLGINGIKTQIKADTSILQVSAASILAKVSKDRVMNFLAKDFPCYEFEKNKAYGTKAHKELIAKFGICKLHRKSFKLL